MTEQAAPAEKGRQKQGFPRPLALALALAITVAAFFVALRIEELPASQRQALFERYGYLAVFLVSMIGNATVIIPAPTFLVAFTGGAFLNPWLVGVVAAAGAILGELTGYLAGVSGQGIIENREMYGRIEPWLRRYGMLTLFVLAAIPNPFFDVAGLAAGALKIPVWQFLFAGWAGKTVKFLALAFLGAGTMRLIGW